MSVFGDMAASARAAHSHFFGGQVTLTEPSRPARTVPAVLGNSHVETRQEDGRELRVTVRECRFTTISSVRHDAVVTIDGVNWSIDEFVDRQGSGLTVKLRRSVANELARPNFRGKH